MPLDPDLLPIPLPDPTLRVEYLTNTAYGYPRGAARRTAPIALACLHITANPSTPPASAQQERDYANRAGSNGPSAHLYIDRDGSGVWAVDPDKYAAWSNGDVQSPRTGVPGINDVLAFRAAGYNANEAYDIEIEHCGRNPDYPITTVQTRTTAIVLARRSIARGLPIERRTVHLHGDLNTVTRRACPVPVSGREEWVAAIIDLANQYRDELLIAARLADLEAQLASAEDHITALSGDLAHATAERDDLAHRLDQAKSLAAQIGEL